MKYTTEAVQPGFVLATSSYQKILYQKEAITHLYSYTHDIHDNLDVVAIPDGCIDIMNEIVDGGIYTHVDGTVLKTKIHHHADNRQYFGLRFYPGILPDIFDVSMKELICSQISLSEALKNKELAKRLEDVKCVQTWFDLFLHAYHVSMLEKKADHKSKARLVQYLRDKIMQTGGQITVNELADDTLYSTRYLERVFKKSVGISTKRFSKIMRFQNAIQQINCNECIQLTDVAIRLGYYDQSHFVKEFKQFTDMSPKNYQNMICNSGYRQRIMQKELYS